MNIDELLLNVNAVSMNSLVQQTRLITQDDLAMYRESGYMTEMTLDEFRSIFDVDPNCVWYTPSISCTSLYFNRDTLAACNFPLLKDTEGKFWFSPAKLKEFAERCEAEVADKNFTGSLLCLPDGLRFPYFNMLIEKYGKDIPDLYDLFMGFYSASDYGFGELSPQVIEAVFNSKTVDEHAKTCAALEDLPDNIVVFRGEGSQSTHYSKAYSWTTDISTAYFFACRRGKNKARVLTGTVAKEDVLEYDPEGEQELLARPGSVKDISVVDMHGMLYLRQILPILARIFQEYLKAGKKLEFSICSKVHGLAHEMRVLLLCLMIGSGMNLTAEEVKILCTAAIYHDTCREDDKVDPAHGARSRAYYEKTEKKPKLLVSLICEYHCRPDEEGYAAIRSTFKNKARQVRYCKLYDIFKDADALDRVRFGLRALDEAQLRTENAKQLPLVARLLYENDKYSKEDT